MLLILGAGYIGAAAAELALVRGEEVVLADNWRTTERAQLDGLENAGARGETADVRYCDPHIPSLELDDVGHAAVPWSAEEVAAADCVVMLTAHREFLAEPHWESARLVVDTRNVIPRARHVFPI